MSLVLWLCFREAFVVLLCTSVGLVWFLGERVSCQKVCGGGGAIEGDVDDEGMCKLEKNNQ